MLRHATTRERLASIRSLGLLTAHSRGRLAAVWLHATNRTAWAMIHTVQRHDCQLTDVAVIEVDVPRSWVRRHSSGLWYCLRDIPPSRLGRAAMLAEVAASPVEGQ